MSKTIACPACDKPGGALTAKPHCTSQTCTWNTCMCGTVYSRTMGGGFNDKPPTHYPTGA